MATDVPPGSIVVTVGGGLRGDWVPKPGPEKGGGAAPVPPGRALGSESARESGRTAPPRAAELRAGAAVWV